METAAKIIAQHDLDTSSLENLAKDIAQRWNYTVEYGAYENQEGQHNFIQYGAIELLQSNVMVTLYDTSKDKNSLHNFVIEHGEEAKIIYNDIIEIQPPWEEQYQIILEKFQTNKMEMDEYYNGVFEECRKIGALKIYFLKDSFHSSYPIDQETTFLDYMEVIKNKIPFFVVNLV